VLIMKTKENRDEQFRQALIYLKARSKLTIKEIAEIGECSDRHIQGILSENEKKGAGRSVTLRIAAHFGMTYEQMLTMGRAILNGEDPEKTPDTMTMEGDQPETDTEAVISATDPARAVQEFLAELPFRQKYGLISKELAKDSKKSEEEAEKYLTDFLGPPWGEKEISKFKEWSKRRALFIWGKACIETGLPEDVYGSRQEELFKQYFNQDISDIELFGEAKTWAAELIASLKNEVR
jgi:hypothetical protein